MKRALLCSCVVLGAACVPASEELPPAGAAGFDTEPSPATSGEPFGTSDGWTVRFERVVIQTSVYATPLSRGYGNSEPYLFDAQKPARLFARALPVGTARVRVELYGRYITTDDRYYDSVERIGVDEETEERFRRFPDEGQKTEYTPGPSVLFVVRAEHALSGRTASIDLAVNASSRSTLDLVDGREVPVREDDIETVALPIRAEVLFPEFGPFADADADGDGFVTAAELRATPAGRDAPTLPQHGQAVTLLDVLVLRAESILVR